MTLYPFDLTEYPLMRKTFPFAVGIHMVERYYPPHRHELLEISLVIGGKGEEVVNGEVHVMEPGTLTLVLPYQIHELKAAPGTPLRLYNCMFSADLLAGGKEYLDGFFETLLNGKDNRATYMQLQGTQSEAVSRLFDELMREYEGGREWREAMCKARLTELMIRIDRLRSEMSAAGRTVVEPETVSDTDTPGRNWKVIRYLHHRFREPLTLSGLAETFHYNETYLSEQIKRHTGKTFLGLLHEIRLRHACSLLASSEMTISAIAYEVGYGSAKTMFKAFRKYKGTTPGAYRSMAGKQ